MTNLYQAVVRQNFDEVVNCLQQHHDLNEPTQTEGGLDYPLNLAASKNLVDIARELLKSGAWVNMIDDLGHTPIDYAIEQGSGELINLLDQYKDQTKPVEKSLNEAFVSAVAQGNVSAVETLYAQASCSKEIMVEASTKLFRKIYNADSASYQSTWKPMLERFLDNPYFENALCLEQYAHSMNLELSWLKVGATAKLYLAKHFDVIDRFLTLDDAVDPNTHPAILVGDTALNILQMAIIYYSGPENLPFIQKLIHEYGMSTKFRDLSSGSMRFEIYQQEDFLKVIPGSPDSDVEVRFNTLSKIDNALELAVTSGAALHVELIDFLARFASDQELLISASCLLNNQDTIARFLQISPVTAKSTIVHCKEECDRLTRQMMGPFLLAEKFKGTVCERIRSWAQEVARSKRPCTPVKATSLFYVAESLNSEARESYFLVRHLLLEKIEERMSALPNTMLEKHLDTFIRLATAGSSLQMAMQHHLAVQLVYSMIKNPGVPHLERMVQSCILKVNADAKLRGVGSQFACAQYQRTGSLILSMVIHQFTAEQIQEFQQSKTYENFMKKLQAIEFTIESVLPQTMLGGNSGISVVTPAVVRSAESNTDAIGSERDSRGVRARAPSSCLNVAKIN